MEAWSGVLLEVEEGFGLPWLGGSVGWMIGCCYRVLERWFVGVAGELDPDIEGEGGAVGHS